MQAPQVLGGIATAPFRTSIDENGVTTFPLGTYSFPSAISFNDTTSLSDNIIRVNSIEAIRNTHILVRRQIIDNIGIQQIEIIDRAELRVGQSQMIRVTNKRNGHSALIEESKSFFLENEYHFELIPSGYDRYYFHGSPWLENRMMTYNIEGTTLRNDGIICRSKILEKKQSINYTNQSMSPWISTASRYTITALRALKLDFGYVEIYHNPKSNKILVAEIGCSAKVLSLMDIKYYTLALPHILIYKHQDIPKNKFQVFSLNSQLTHEV